MCHKENCFQCVIDEVKDMRDMIVAIRDEIHPLVSC